MPQGENFWNPYRLIPAKSVEGRTTPLTDERFQSRSHSGMIQCTIENLTPLFVGGSTAGNHHPPLKRENKRLIPGSSLKGMLRTLTEIVGGGCFVVKDGGTPLAKAMQTCSSFDQLCIACRMFGAIPRDTDQPVHKGNISVGDALIQEQEPKVIRLQVLLANNRLRHAPFYWLRKPQTIEAARKAYFHQPRRINGIRPVPAAIRDRAWYIDAMEPGHHFDFEIQFTSLTDDELNLLLYTICLESQVEVTLKEGDIRLAGPMRHKIGNGKPLGLGSCHVKINRLVLLPPASTRFASMTRAPNHVLTEAALEQELLQRTEKFRSDNSLTMQALRKIMVWDENDKREFCYPDHHWFQNPANKSTRLKEI